MSEFPDPLPVAANLPPGYLSHDLAGTGKVGLSTDFTKICMLGLVSLNLDYQDVLHDSFKAMVIV